MKFMLWLLALSGFVITVRCHLEIVVANPGGIGGIFKGPDSETIIKGPDGSVITSQEKGGIVQTEQRLDPIIVAEPEILEVGYPISPTLVEDGYISPLASPERVISSVPPIDNGHISPFANSDTLISTVGSSLPPIGPTIVAPLEPTIQGTLSPQIKSVTPVFVDHTVDIVEPDSHIIETEIIDAPAIESNESTDLVGPSGSISTRGSESIVSGPASTTITKTAKVLVAPPVISGVPVVSQVFTAIHPPPFVEVNNEIPLESPVPVISPAVGSPISSTVSPLNLNSLSVSTIAPPVVSPIASSNRVAFDSTVVPPLLRRDGSIVTNTRYSLGSTIAPPTVQHPSYFVRAQPENLGSNISPQTIKQQGSIFATGLLTGEQFEDVRPGLLGQTIPVAPTSSISAQHTGQVLVSTVTPGVSVEDDGTSGFIQPGSAYGGIHSSTLSPVPSTATPTFYNQDALTNRQLIINPANIPTRNIVPPEIGVPRGAIDLGTTVTSVTRDHYGVPRAPGLSNLQGIDNDNIQRVENIQRFDNNVNIQRVDNDPVTFENSLQNGYYHNEILLGNNPNDVYSHSELIAPNVPLLTNTNPIHNRFDIPQRGVPDTELRQQGVYPSQIQFTNVPLSDVASLSTRSEPETGSQRDYDDRIATGLLNRYERKIRNRKYQ